MLWLVDIPPRSVLVSHRCLFMYFLTKKSNIFYSLYTIILFVLYYHFRGTEGCLSLISLHLYFIYFHECFFLILSLDCLLLLVSPLPFSLWSRSVAVPLHSSRGMRQSGSALKASLWLCQQASFCGLLLCLFIVHVLLSHPLFVSWPPCGPFCGPIISQSILHVSGTWDAKLILCAFFLSFSSLTV